MVELRECCIQFNLPIDPELLVQLIDYCDINGDGAIDYSEFANFLNWKDKMAQQGGGPANLEPDAVTSAKSENIQKQIDNAIGKHRTSASMINATVGGVSTKGNKFGIAFSMLDINLVKSKQYYIIIYCNQHCQIYSIATNTVQVATR